MDDLPTSDIALLNGLFGYALLWPEEYLNLLTPQGRHRILAEQGCSEKGIKLFDSTVTGAFDELNDLAAAIYAVMNST